jgi:hypothetical protein
MATFFSISAPQSFTLSARLFVAFSYEISGFWVSIFSILRVSAKANTLGACLISELVTICDKFLISSLVKGNMKSSRQLTLRCKERKTSMIEDLFIVFLMEWDGVKKGSRKGNTGLNISLGALCAFA